ncbi:MAG TPA: DMT family transporter [Tepidisphaeraceae bacterium]|jgi:drug/metabolite transporter (DMT)-like permease
MTTRSHRLAILILGFCCICWGFSFPTMQIGAAAVSRALRASTDAPISELAIRGTFNGCRFALAGLICLALTPRRFTRITRPDLTGGLAVGAFFGGGMLLQVYGLRYALPSVSSFLTALSVVFAPITQSLLFRRPVGSRVWLSIAIAMAGMIILSAGGAQSSAQGALIQPSPIPYLGEILTILGASLFTAQILAVDHFGQRADPSRLTTVMLLTAGALNLAIGLSTGGTILLRSQTLHLLLHDSSFLWPFTGLVLLSSVLALKLMNAWQPRITPATATVVYCLEPVFGTLFSIAFQTESLTPKTTLGGAIILAAVLTLARTPSSSTMVTSISVPNIPIE